VITGATHVTVIDVVPADAVTPVGLSGAEGKVADENATHSEFPLAFLARIE
jgi:hypothetical protein